MLRNFSWENDLKGVGKVCNIMTMINHGDIVVSQEDESNCFCLYNGRLDNFVIHLLDYSRQVELSISDFKEELESKLVDLECDDNFIGQRIQDIIAYETFSYKLEQIISGVLLIQIIIIIIFLIEVNLERV